MSPRRGPATEPVLAVAKRHARPGLVQHELSVVGAIIDAVQVGGRIAGEVVLIGTMGALVKPLR